MVTPLMFCNKWSHLQCIAINGNTFNRLFGDFRLSCLCRVILKCECGMKHVSLTIVNNRFNRSTEKKKTHWSLPSNWGGLTTDHGMVIHWLHTNSTAQNQRSITVNNNMYTIAKCENPALSQATRYDAVPRGTDLLTNRFISSRPLHLNKPGDNDSDSYFTYQVDQSHLKRA